MIKTNSDRTGVAPEQGAKDHPASRPPYIIAGWRFDPSTPLLEGEDEVRTLEDRAARALALLCRRRGEVVSKAELLEEVWGGRSVSDNSVSIVMGSLRRALGDDPASPWIIVTVARRGYRLLCGKRAEGASPLPTAPAAKPSGRGRAGWFVAALVSVAAAIGLWTILRSPAKLTLSALAPENASGDRRYDQLAASLAPVVVQGANRLPQVLVLDGVADQRPRIALKSKVILWNGAPELALSATDTRTQAVIWSAFAAGPPGLLARHVEDRIAGLGSHLPR